MERLACGNYIERRGPVQLLCQAEQLDHFIESRVAERVVPAEAGLVWPCEQFVARTRARVPDYPNRAQHTEEQFLAAVEKWQNEVRALRRLPWQREWTIDVPEGMIWQFKCTRGIVCVSVAEC